MMSYFSENLWLLWTIVIFVCLILELSSGDFYVTCFAIGALGGVLAALLDMPLWVQVTIWALCSMLSLRLVRPHLLRLLHKNGKERVSNADALIGREGIVIETIEPQGHGYVQVDGDQWRAVTTPNTIISKGSRVRIIGRDSIVVTVEEIK